MSRQLVLDSTDPAYGKVCECGAKKSLLAAMCMACRLEQKRGNPVYSEKQYSAELAEVWPIPLHPLPPFIWAPRVHLWDRGERGQ
jgi:hypothetical protein